MCGIAGIVRPRSDQPVDEDALLRMAAAIRHRGPDGFGLAQGDGAGLVSARLAIFDIPGGWQPSRVDGGSGIVVYNGEVYNHPELRQDLEREGAVFRTTCDTEVVHALLERDGLAALHALNGQFAFAWWQPERRRLTLGRDRFGVRPLHYALLADGSIVFGSEAKALFASGEVAAEPDPAGLDEVFTLWGAIAPRTPFRGVRQVPPGSFVVWEDGEITAARRWWSDEDAKAQGLGNGDAGLEELMRDSVRLRLRADVPVGTYLSGGLDSSLITALAQQERGGDVRSFSIAFSDPGYDERRPPGGGRRGARHRASRARGEHEPDRGGSAGGRLAHGDAADPNRAGPPFSARAGGAQAAHHGGRDRRGRRRGLLGL